MIGFAMAMALGANRASNVMLLSLGTGEPEAPEGGDIGQIMGDEPWWELAGPAVGSLSAGAGQLARDLLAAIPGLDYHRLQPTLSPGVDARMDNGAPGNIAALRAVTEAFVGQNESLLRGLAAKLV